MYHEFLNGLMMTVRSSVLITGGAGFLGSHFVNYVVEKYPNVHFICVDKLNYASHYSTNLIKVLNNINLKFIEKDLSCELEYLQNLIKIHNVSQIINFAAESCVDRSFQSPLYFTTNNILATQNLLECCRLSDHKISFLHISTDEVYGEQEIGQYVDENSKLNPTNPYSASKASIDLIIQSYIYSYKLQITILRSNNVYGYGQYPEKIVPIAINTLDRIFQNGKQSLKIPIHGDGHYKRTYLYVTDFLKAVELLWNQNGKGNCFGEIYNVGGDDDNEDYEMSNLDLIRFICDCYFKKYNIKDRADNYIEFIKDRNYNDSRYLLDCSKIKALGWSPTITLQSGIPKIL